MNQTTNIISEITLETVSYENFICYFEKHYLAELSGYNIYERRIEYLTLLKKIALEHRYMYELRHGQGAYQASLGKYGALSRTPLQIIEGDFNSTHLLMPKIAHNYATQFGKRNSPTPNNLRWSRFAAA